MAETEASMLTCRELVELVSEYLDGALPPGERARFDAHLRECDPCVEFVAQIERTIALSGHLDPDGIAPRVRDHMIERFRGWRSDRANVPNPAGEDRRQ